jgi:predicted DCC family thiol-disulfide oxidoreductase YuxK
MNKGVSASRKPLLVWDGKCGFCRAWIARWQRITGDRVDYAAYQAAAPLFPTIPIERFKHSVQLIEPGDRLSQGAEAVFRALAYAPGYGWPLALYRRLPFFAPASEAFYWIVARNRNLFSFLTRIAYGAHVVPPGEVFTSWIFLRLLGAIYTIAFVSLWTQIAGLYGSKGILPAAQYLAAVRSHYGIERHWLLPTLAWLNVSDVALAVMCGAGAVLGFLLLLGAAPILTLVGCWALYLSLANVGREFLWFQWDSLLLETGFLAIFLAPWRELSRPATDPAPARSVLWMMRWLLFRLMFSSAAVKLTSGDPTWHNLTALQYHYETQCLPPWTAWYAHHLPASFQRWSAIGMFAIEGLAPFLIMAPRRIRMFGAAAMALLQVLIVLTGNYCFFNLLTLALIVLLLDDAVWPLSWRGRVAGADPHSTRATRGRWPGWITGTVAVALFVLSFAPLAGALRLSLGRLGALVAVEQVVDPFRVVNGYGLFAVMTTKRDEIIVEGSADGRVWRPYEFRYKPGDVMRRPRFVAPHQPRLDWQMWFAALGDWRASPWYLDFCQRLLEGSRPVLGLLEKNPFPDAPPRYVRGVLYQYHFTDAATRRASGAWWRREERGPFGPVLTLVNGRLVALPGDEGRGR